MRSLWAILVGIVMILWTVSSFIIGNVVRLSMPLIIGTMMVVCTALWNTAIGKMICIIIAGWIAVNIFGMDLSSVEAITNTAAENPHIIVDTALEWLL